MPDVRIECEIHLDFRLNGHPPPLPETRKPGINRFFGSLTGEVPVQVSGWGLHSGIHTGRMFYRHCSFHERIWIENN